MFMKKIEYGLTEYLGIAGSFIWVIVIMLRGLNLSNNSIYNFILGILPNLGAAWIFTLLFKWLIIYVFKKQYNIKTHAMVCVSIFVLALISEIIHHYFLNSPFDIFDMVITIIAQGIIFFIPIHSNSL